MGPEPTLRDSDSEPFFVAGSLSRHDSIGRLLFFHKGDPPQQIQDRSRPSVTPDLIRLTLDGQDDCFTGSMGRHLSAISRCIGFMLRGNALTRVAINEIRQFQRHELRVSDFQERYARMQRAETLPAKYRYYTP